MKSQIIQKQLIGLGPKLADAASVQIELWDQTARVQFEFRSISPSLVPCPSSRSGTCRKSSEPLWKKSCFEVFVRSQVGPYQEWNFSPNGLWNTYRFVDIRQPAPIHLWPGPQSLELTLNASTLVANLSLSWQSIVDLCWAQATGKLQVWATAVLATDSETQYWAGAHPTGQADFHDPRLAV